LPFVEDDYPAALADARRTGRPIFVDAWAPWCHSCLSLRSFVLTDPLLAPLADRYVWLSIDTEKERNAAFVAKFTHESLPTLWVIRGDDESVLRKWSGTLTAQELRAMLEGGASAASAVASVHARVLAASKDDPAACARLGAHEGPSLPRGTPRADVLATALACAHEARLEAETLALLGLALEDARRADLLLADDRSALYEAVVSVMRDRRDPTEAQRVAREWAAFLETEAEGAKDAAARAVFDPHRVEAYLALGEPARAIPMLEQSARDFPSDYNPHARLARVYLEMKRLDEAHAAIARAHALVYGPRILRVASTLADVEEARGERTAARRAIEAALVRTEGLVLTANQQKLRRRLAERANALGR
jgi:thiol-disulfide isomerase/thioredoxin